MAGPARGAMVGEDFSQAISDGPLARGGRHGLSPVSKLSETVDEKPRFSVGETNGP